VGTGGSTALPKQTAGLITLRSSVVGKKNRGRQYVPFPATASDQGAGVPTLLYLADLIPLGAALRNVTVVGDAGPANTADFSPIIWKKGSPTHAFITSMVVRRAWATQRKRGDYGRLNASPI
jgi:hypothetical protein